MEYDEMTSEEYENQISDKAEFEYDRMKEERLIAKYETESDFREKLLNFCNENGFLVEIGKITKMESKE